MNHIVIFNYVSIPLVNQREFKWIVKGDPKLNQWLAEK